MKVGGTFSDPIQKFRNRYVYSSHVPFAKQELQASKTLTTQWITYANAFKKVTKQMSYAQVLSKNIKFSSNNTVQQASSHKRDSQVHTSKMNPTQLQNANKTRTCYTGAIKNLSKIQNDGKKSAVTPTNMACVKARGGSVTTENKQPHKAINVNVLTLKNRFEPLQGSPVTEPTEDLSHCCNTTQLKADINLNATPLKLKLQNSQSTVKLKNNIKKQSLSDSSSKPQLPIQANFQTLEGNKNETGFFTEGCDNTTVTMDFRRNMASQVTSTSLDSHTIIPNVGISTKLKPQYPNSVPNIAHCDDNNVMPSQNIKSSPEVHQSTFGFLPTSPLKIYNGDPIYWDTIPDLIKAHKIIRQSGLPNFLKCRIPVQSGLNINAWRSHLQGYWDAQICDLLQYGFPLDFDRSFNLLSNENNHTSALTSSESIQEYLTEELKFKAILGPFHNKPISLHVSPLMVRDKQNSSTKRTIMDLSWPHGASVNDGVLKDSYLQTTYDLRYPSIDLITDCLRKLGPSAQIYKVDISRAFRQIKVDPADIDLLGIKFNQKYYIDRSIPFGFRHGSQIFQRCTDAIRHIMASHGFHTFFNYIDDLIYIGLPSEIQNSFQFLTTLLQQLGLDISTKKLVPPATSVVCLGILIDSVNKTVSIPPDKLSQINATCRDWNDRTYCSKKDLQSLLGSLLYITKCVKSARYFLNRMLQLLRDNHNNSKILLTAEFKKDLNWFNSFLVHYNGVTFYNNKYCHFEVHLDASLTGLGGAFKDMVYALPLPVKHGNYTIVHLEILNVVVALKIWASHWANHRIKMYCDNMAVVEVLQAGKARDQTLATCARNIWLICALYNIDLIVVHIPGKQNVLADLLSRWTFSNTDLARLNAILPNFQWLPTHLDLTLLNHTI